MALVKYNNNSISTISSAGQLASGSLVPIKTLTISNSANATLINGSSDVVLDGTYPIYIIKLINIHPASDREEFTMNLTSDGTNFNVTKTTTCIEVYNWENGSTPVFAYRGNLDLAQSTGEQSLATGCGNDNDENICSIIHLFNPSSTTFVKHFLVDTQFTEGQGLCFRQPVAGYANTTSAITGIRFKFASGNIASGTIKLYGIKDS